MKPQIISKNSISLKPSNSSSLVYVAMSGGVDSSVAAALLKKGGYRVVGVFFKPWQPTPPGLPLGGGAVGFCNWREDRLEAMRVATRLGIEFKTWDFSKEYGTRVAQYMIEGYRAGITPNPDVMCNKEIKFGLFLKKALSEGADFIATGHYARIGGRVEGIGHSKKKLHPSPYTLLKARDTNKDQTYFLWTLTQEQLRHCLFPIGGYTKPQVRAMAKKFGLPNFAKKDSQGVCFVGELDMHDFLKEYIKPKTGQIYLVVEPLSSGSVVQPLEIGTHEGVAYYTIGQRHGLDIKTGGGPYYVAKKDIRKNILYVTRDKLQISNNKLQISEVNWIAEKPKLPTQISVQIRYRTSPVSVKLMYLDTCFMIHAKQPLVALAPGQSAVFYRGQEVLGGGIIQ